MIKWSDMFDYFRPEQTTIATPSAPVVQNNPPNEVGGIDPLDLSTVTFDKSPNQTERNDEVRAIVLHHTGPGKFTGVVSWLKNPDAKVSAHYVVGYNGELVQLVNTAKKAWHAGTSKCFLDGADRKDLNNCTIGIEICNPGVITEHEGKFYYSRGGDDMVPWTGAAPHPAQITYPSGKVLSGYAIDYPEVQKNKVIALCKGLVKKYPNIGREDILTHFQICIPESRKNDPFGLDINDIINKIFE